MDTLLKLISRNLEEFFQLRFVMQFKRHNYRHFHSPKVKGSNVVLMELNEMHSAHIPYSYLANELSNKYSARIQPYQVTLLAKAKLNAKYYFLKYLAMNVNAIYRSFGAEGSPLQIDITPKQNSRVAGIFSDVVSRLKTNKELEDLRINGIWYGDLIYDTYLMRYKRPTVDLNSNDFRAFLMEALRLIVFWEDYFELNNVCAVNVSHCVYINAIPLRIAVEKNIPAYQANATHIYKMDKINYFAYNDFFYFRKIFSLLKRDVQQKGIEEAEHRIKRRFSGEIGVDMSYSTKSAYNNERSASVINKSDKPKFLIATHCFFDSPHSYGNNLFPDFYEWIDFLGKISEVTDYDWYIKTHPDYLPGTMEIIERFARKYPKFTIIPAKTSHHQIVEEGISCALTVYGTIAFEYAALGVPVINCSLCNPHIAYDFNFNPKSIEEYRQLIIDFKIESKRLVISRAQILEYYYMKNIYNTENMFFEDCGAVMKKIGGYGRQFTPLIYREWISKWTMNRHNEIKSAISNFIRSGDFRMNYCHFQSCAG